MLATAAPAVKLQTYSTPEQAGCAHAIDRSLTIFWCSSNASALPRTSDGRFIRLKRSSFVTSWRWDSTCFKRFWSSPAMATPGRP